MKRWSLFLIGMGLLGSAGVRAGEPPLRLVASTGLVADVVRRVAGDAAEVQCLIPPDADPHGYQPRPADLARLEKADALFVNGFKLEPFLDRVTRNPDLARRVVSLDQGIEPLRLGEPCQDESHDHAAHGDEVHAHAHGDADPHVWFDPRLVIIWTQTIERELCRLRPAETTGWQKRAAAYREELKALDAWIAEQTASLPPARRLLITDHAALGYFAARYNFRQVGSLVPGLSTMAQPSAREIAGLEQELKSLPVKAIFVSQSVNPQLAERVARDTGGRVVMLYTGALSGPHGPAADYLSFMKHNVKAIVDALQ